MYSIDSNLSKRFEALRAICIVLVVYIHSAVLPLLSVDIVVPEYVAVVKKIMGNEGGIGTLAVPGFYFISAYLLFLKKTPWIENVRKKLSRIVLPFVAINLFWTLLFKIMQHIPAVSHMFAGEQYTVVTVFDWIKAIFSWNPMYYPFWFLWYLIIFNIISPVIRYFIKRFPILFLCFVLMIGFSIINIPFLRVDNFVFFVIGGYFAIYDMDIKKLDRIPLVMSILFFGVVFCFEYLFSVPYLIILEICAGLILLYKLSYYMCDNKVIYKLSRYSFFIYCTHEFYEAIIKKIVMSILPQYGMVQLLEYIVLPMFIIAMCTVIGMIFDRYIKPKYLRCAIGLPKE